MAAAHEETRAVCHSCPALFRALKSRERPPAIAQPDSRRKPNIGRGMVASRAEAFLNRFVVRSPLSSQPTLASRAKGRLVRLVDRLSPAGLDRRVLSGHQQRIAGRFAGMFCDSNRRLEALTGLDLKRFGYM